MSTAPNTHQSLQAGYAEVDFTPLPGLALLGQMHYRAGETVRDPLMASAAAFRSGDSDETVVIVSVDICMLNNPFVRETQQFFAERTGLDAGRLLMHSTHTHVAPTVFTLLAAKAEPQFVAAVQSAILSAATTALGRLEPVTGHAGTGHMEHMGWNRRAMLADGSSAMYASSATEGFIGMEGPRDPALPVFCTRNADGDITGVVVSFATHPNAIEGESRYSADIPGASRAAIKGLLGRDVPVVYLTGAAGNTAPSILDPVNPDQPWRGELGLRRSGWYLGGEAARTIAAATEPMASTTVKVEQATFDVPLREWPAEGEPTFPRWKFADSGQDYYAISKKDWPRRLQEENPWPVRVNVVRIGDVAICTNPAELFVEWGLEIKAASPALVTIVSQLTDGYCGYVPTLLAFQRGGYETWCAPTSQLLPEAGTRIVDTTRDLLKKAW